MYLVSNRHADSGGTAVDTGWLGAAAAAAVRTYHAALPAYRPTPLVALPGLAADLDLGAIWVKDEAQRFGLGAFKALGASYALQRFLQLQEPPSDAPITIVTASEGNHGRAVAWAARGRGHHAVIYLPDQVSEHRVEAIRGLGAEAVRIAGSYEEACARAARDAEERGWLLLQDVAWPGYEEIPRWIMQGYLSTVDEAFEQLGDARPTHVLLQCGVGGFAAAVTGWLVQRFGAAAPRLVLVEPEGAASAVAAFETDTEEPPLLGDEPATFMACLCCAQLSYLAWPVLRAHADVVVACPDHVARVGMRTLAHPVGDDPMLVSGESGAVTVGLLSASAWPARDEQLRRQLRLGPDARVLLFSTEGATDPEIYAQVVG